MERQGVNGQQADDSRVIFMLIIHIREAMILTIAKLTWPAHMQVDNRAGKDDWQLVCHAGDALSTQRHSVFFQLTRLCRRAKSAHLSVTPWQPAPHL